MLQSDYKAKFIDVEDPDGETYKARHDTNRTIIPISKEAGVKVGGQTFKQGTIVEIQGQEVEYEKGAKILSFKQKKGTGEKAMLTTRMEGHIDLHRERREGDDNVGEGSSRRGGVYLPSDQ